MKLLKGYQKCYLFFITRKECYMKKLEQIRQESKDKIDDTEERLRQLKNQKNFLFRYGKTQ